MKFQASKVNGPSQIEKGFFFEPLVSPPRAFDGRGSGQRNLIRSDIKLTWLHVAIAVTQVYDESGKLCCAISAMTGLRRTHCG